MVGGGEGNDVCRLRCNKWERDPDTFQLCERTFLYCMVIAETSLTPFKIRTAVKLLRRSTLPFNNYCLSVTDVTEAIVGPKKKIFNSEWAGQLRITIHHHHSNSSNTNRTSPCDLVLSTPLHFYQRLISLLI